MYLNIYHKKTKLLHFKLQKNLIFLIGVLLLFVYSCRTESYLSISKHKQYEQHNSKIQKIILLDPDYGVFVRSSGSRGIGFDPVKSEKEFEYFNERIKLHGKKSGIDIIVQSSLELKADDVDFFNDILGLKKDISISNQYQDLSGGYKVKNSIWGEWFRPLTGYYPNAPRISPEFSHLASKFGTPYVGLMRTFTANSGVRAGLYYFVLVDLLSCEIIYREIRILKGKMNKSRLESILYDSLRIIKRK